MGAYPVHSGPPQLVAARAESRANSPRAPDAISKRIPLIDAIRAGAALLVVLQHLRNFLFVDFSALTAPGPLVKAFYYMTGFGHQSVIVFFVLSGYLVGGAVIRAEPHGFWRNYALTRMSRLWIVLLPCLLLTAFWDVAAASTSSGAAYLNGRFGAVLFSAPKAGGVDLSLGALLGNAFFLQTILVPSYGNNVPLWSLANEFWYYLLFPLAYGALVWRITFTRRLGFGLIAGAFLALLPADILLGGVLWLAGVAVAYLERAERVSWLRHRHSGIAAAVVFLAALHASRNGRQTDLLLALALAAALPWLTTCQMTPGAWQRLAALLADCSYTLYLCHVPMLGFAWSALLGARRFTAGPDAFALFLLLLATVLGYTLALYWVFERNTGRLRRYLAQRLPAAPTPTTRPALALPRAGVAS